MKQFIIYGLRCPKTDEYKYIGKSSSGILRAQAHLTYSHNESVNHWVAELREQGLCPLIDILEECQEEDLQIKEKFWIQFYESKGCSLLNFIIYKGSSIEKLQQDIIIEQEKLNNILQGIKGEIAELSQLKFFIRNRRKQLGLTQNDLAEICNISPNTLYSIEKGNYNASYKIISDILDALGYVLIPSLKKINI